MTAARTGYVLTVRQEAKPIGIRFAILDVDDVLLATVEALDASSRAMLVPLTEHLGSGQAAAVQREFTLAMGLLTRQLRACGGEPEEDCVDLMRRTARWQRGLTEAGFEVKVWSRHALLACALESCGLPVTTAIVTAAADLYWTTLATQAAVWPDAAALVRRLRAAGVAVHLATGSDGFLAFDDARQTFSYSPERSTRLKLDRLRSLAQLGFCADDITVGDPVDKPRPEFYRRVLRRFAYAAGCDVDLDRTVVVGDGLGNDVLPLLELGAARGVWLLRDRAAAKRAGGSHPRVTVASALDSEETWDTLSA